MDKIHFVDSSAAIELAPLGRWLWLFAWTNNKWKLHPGLNPLKVKPVVLLSRLFTCLQCYNIKATTVIYSFPLLHM